MVNILTMDFIFHFVNESQLNADYLYSFEVYSKFPWANSSERVSSLKRTLTGENLSSVFSAADL